MWRENIPLPRLRELQKDVVRIERRHDQARASQAEPAAQHVVAEERERRMKRHAGDRWRAVAGDQIVRRERRVAVDRLQMVADVAVREMLEIPGEARGLGALQRDRLVHPALLPFAGAAIVETQLIVRIPVGAADPASEIPGEARNAIATM